MVTYTETFDTSGEYTLELDPQATNIWVEIHGAGGGGGYDNSSGGDGGYVEGFIPDANAAGKTLTIYVGGGGEYGGHETSGPGGFNGGGTSEASSFEYSGGGGGGASDIRIGGTTLDDRVAVAGGGGGGGGAEIAKTSYRGGDGGGLEGNDGNGGDPGGGGTQTSGGTSGGGGDDGSFGVGGNGGGGSSDEGSGGGGGGGLYGGGGGAEGLSGDGGGGGSSYIDELTSATTTTGGGSAGGSADSNGSDGMVVIEYEIVVDAPDDLTVAAERDTEIDLAWTDVDSDADGHRIYRSTSSPVDPATDTLVDDVPQGTESYTDTGLDNGTTYHYLIETYQDTLEGVITDTSNEVSGQTTIPDVEDFMLDGTVQNELLAEDFGTGLNTGQYRIRWKESDASSYPSENEATVSHDADPLEYNIVDVLDGEQYDVGVRAETAEVDGTWHEATELTKLYPASGITATSTDLFAITVEWTVESDFDGSQEVWRRREDGTRDRLYSDEKGTLVATVGATTEEFLDDDSDALAPDRDVTYTIRTVTDYVYADASATLSTASAGLAQQPSGSRGWFVEIDHPDGQTLTPQILDDVQVEPRLNDLPRVQVPIPRDDRYLGDDLEGAPMRVYKGGHRLPIDELRDVETGPATTTLIGIGGTQLEQRVQTDVDTRESHLLAEDLIQAHTGYTPNVDAPVIESLTDELAQSASTAEEFDEQKTTTEGPSKVANDGVEDAQSLFLRDVGGSEIDDYNGIAGSAEFEEASAGVGRTLDSSSDFIRFNAQTLEYDIRSDDVGVAIRWGGDAGGNDADTDIEVAVLDADDNSTVGSVEFNTGAGLSDLTWDFDDSQFGTEWDGGDLTAGDYKLRISPTEDGDNGTFVDLICFYDASYNYTWDNSVHEPSGYLDGPELYPDAEPVEFDQVETIYSVTAARVDSVWTDVSNSQALEVSNDGGVSWKQVSNSQTLDQAFDDLGASLRLRATISRHSPNGARSATPRYGYASQRLESYDLMFDGNDTPLTINQTYDADLSDILATIADDSNSVWEVQQDGDQTTIEWCQPGQRTASDALALEDYSTTKRSVKTLKAVVKGGRSSERETITADPGTTVDLVQDSLIPGTEVVRDADTDERYRYGRDYDVGNATGTFTVTTGGAISSGQTLEIEYEFKVSGSYAADEFDGDARNETVVDLPSISTARGCELAAKILVDELKTARWEADVEIPPAETAPISLVEEIDVDMLPGDELVVYGLQESPSGLRLRLGSRDRIDDVVGEIQSRLEATSERV